MGNEDDLNASIAHVVLCCVAGRGVTAVRSNSFTQPGMHANLFLHGVIGFLHYQNRTSVTAASLNRDKLSVHDSIIVPKCMCKHRCTLYFLTLVATNVAVNITIFVAGGTFNNDFRPAYNISYKASRYLPLPCLMADLYRGNNNLSMLHLVSGVIPFVLALAGKDDRELGNLMIAGNIISLCYYSLEHKKDWGWGTAGAALFAYFLTAQMSPKVMYPLGLALMEYCAYRIFYDQHDSTAPPPPRN